MAEAKRLYLHEGRSALEVARILDAPSRNTICGMAWRQGWRRDEDTNRQIARAANAEKNRKAPAERAEAREMLRRLKAAQEPKRVEPALVDVGKGGKLPLMSAVMPIDADPIAFMHRPQGRCCWPIGPVTERATADSLVCGARAGERPYCPAHTRQSVTGRKLPPVRAYDPTIIRNPLQRQGEVA